jgi:hypothetical protein
VNAPLPVFTSGAGNKDSLKEKKLIFYEQILGKQGILEGCAAGGRGNSGVLYNLCGGCLLAEHC